MLFPPLSHKPDANLHILRTLASALPVKALVLQARVTIPCVDHVPVFSPHALDPRICRPLPPTVPHRFHPHFHHGLREKATRPLFGSLTRTGGNPPIHSMISLRPSDLPKPSILLFQLPLHQLSLSLNIRTTLSIPLPILQIKT